MECNLNRKLIGILFEQKKYKVERRTMMKKLLVLALVLGIASFASAGVQKAGDDGIMDPDFMIQGRNGNGTDGQYLFMAVTGAGVGAINFIYAGSDTLATEYLGADPDLDALAQMMVDDAAAGNAELIGGPIVSLLFVEFTDLSATPPSSEGDLASIVLNMGTSAYMLDGDDFSVLGAKTFVPEPMTMALLGLGGLFLRRRK
jgi:hypothetical protein